MVQEMTPGMCISCRSIEHDFLSFQKRASEQLADRIANVGSGDNCDRPFLPLTVPEMVSACIDESGISPRQYTPRKSL